MLAIFLAISFGTVFAGQTAINAQLRKYVISPFLASMISFVVGMAFLTMILFISGSPIGIPLELFVNQPVYIWLGGIFGAIALTVNILLFPKLGSVQTTIMPVLGMTLMSMMIDHYGWFNSIQYSFGLSRGVGVFLLIIGVFLSITVQNNTTHFSQEVRKGAVNQWVWRLIGILAGMMLALQVAINGQLGKVLHSPTQAALISFFVGVIILMVIVRIRDRSYLNIREPIRQSAPWWVWVGGILGGSYVLINIYLVGQIGNGQTVILLLFGQIAGSLMVEQFGLFNSIKRQIRATQILGLMIMLAGIFLIRIY